MKTFHAAWISTTGPVSNNILCSWHVDKAWRQNLSKSKRIQRIEKQKIIYKTLKVLQTVTDEIQFNKVLNKLIN